jgi:hypothetical protein
MLLCTLLKVNNMKFDIPNASLIFALMVTPLNVVSLFQSGNIVLTLLGVALLAVGVLNGYLLAARINEQRKLEKVLKSELAEQAIARLASVQGISLEQAQESISNLAIGFSAEGAEAILQRFAMKIIGDGKCIYNAQSPYLRCTVNPDGPCDLCQYFEGK